MITRLIKGLQEREIHNCVNLVFVSDHGMSAVGKDKVIKLSDSLKPFSKKYFNAGYGPVSGISLKPQFKGNTLNYVI